MIIVSLIRRLARLLRSWKSKPRFGTPGLGLAAALAIAAVLLVFLTSGPKAAPTSRSPQPVPDPPVQERPAPAPKIELPKKTLPVPEPEAEGRCPNGCDVPPPDCLIKGNISPRTGERIYHLPGQQFYDRTVISPEKDEAWFCTEEEARANGWRRAKV